MGEIKRFDFEMRNHGGCDMNYCDMCYTEIEEAEDGGYIKYEDHLKAIAEAEGAAVKKFLNKTLSFECKEVDCGKCPNDGLLCGLNSVVRAYVRVYGVDEVIKKVEGL